MTQEINLSQEFVDFFDSYEWKEYLWRLSQKTESGGKGK